MCPSFVIWQYLLEWDLFDSTSELRLIESMDHICDTMLEYNVHKERTDSTRFAKGISSTFKTLHGLVDKGVKVDLGIPYDLWDKPSAEVSYLKSQVGFAIFLHLPLRHSHSIGIDFHS